MIGVRMVVEEVVMEFPSATEVSDLFIGFAKSQKRPSLLNISDKLLVSQPLWYPPTLTDI
jgi:hypothetical protein